MQKFISFADKVSKRTGTYTSYLILPMIGVIVYTAFMRYILKAAVDWGFEVSVFVYGVHCFLGGGYTMLVKGHINVDILPNRLPVRGKKLMEIFSFIIVLAVCFIMIWLGSKWAWKSTMVLERSIHQTVFNPPIWWFKWVVPISAALVALQALGDMFRAIQSLSTPKKDQ